MSELEDLREQQRKAESERSQAEYQRRTWELDAEASRRQADAARVAEREAKSRQSGMLVVVALVALAMMLGSGKWKV